MLDEGTTQFEKTDPLSLFDVWYADAWASEPDANAMACATADGSGAPTVRMVLLKGRDPKGFVFYTNFESRKGRDISATGRVALAFHWKSLKRQIRIDGTVEPISDEEADGYFATRPHDSQVAAWAAIQSKTMEDRFELEKRFASYSVKYEGKTVPRPPHWSGYRVVPEAVEFWLDRPFRLHERILFTRDGEGWSVTRLHP